MGLMRWEGMAGAPACAGAALMLRPRILVEAARHGARLRIERGAAPLSPAERLRAVESERLHETLRRSRSALYRPAHHVEALSVLFADRSLGGAETAGGRAEPPQTNASGSADLRRAM